MSNKSVLTGLLTSQILLAVICLVHLFAFVAYLLHFELSPFLFPASVIVAIGLHFLSGKRLGADPESIMFAALISLLALGISILLAWFYFDLSWDGQAYHQAAVYNLGGKWNPIYQQLETPDQLNDSSVLFFPKNSWLFGAALLRLFGNVELGKAYNFIVLFAAFGAVYALCRSFKLKVWQSLVLTCLTLLNPVVWSELPGYLNDGDLYLLLVIYLASMLLWLRQQNGIYLSIGLMAVVCLVNVKFTGLVFFLIASLFILIYILVKKRNIIKSFLITHFIAGIVAVFVFGFNPYVTNFINRGNPLYPVLGSEAFKKGPDTNEKFETPKNMKGKSLLVRLFYANFGQPGNAPYNKEKNAILTPPFTTNTKLWTAYNYQETRVSGFGPYFGVLLVLVIIAFPVLLIGDEKSRWPALLFLAGLCCCLSLSKHFWWPRFFPVLWLAPLAQLFLLRVIDAEASMKNKVNRWAKVVNIYSWLLVMGIACNGLIVAFIHMKWETTSSVTLRTQLDQLSKQKHPIEIDYGKFKQSVEEKLNYWHIEFMPTSLKHLHTESHKLTSVVKGYPNQVWYRVK